MDINSRISHVPGRHFAGAIALALLLFVGNPQPASAWSGQGHRMIGILAAEMLDADAKAAVADLLRDEADPTLGGVAAWADEVRPEDAWKHTAPWHYVNIKDGECHYAAARDCANGDCVIAAINAQLAVLKDHGQPRQTRIEALKFVVHFIGDVHQPLHASGRTDRGGNDYQINYRDGSENGQGTNIHGVWDYWILASHDKDAQRYAAELAGEGFAHNARDRLPGNHAAQWAEESCRSVEQPGFYPKGHVIDGSYLDLWRPLAQQRLREAAVRLSEALNAAL
ncbi:MAG: S1/P1 nuclease [Lysobacteraceae bacterium]